MNEKSRRVLYMVGGIYLVYLGGNLILQQVKEATSNAPVAIGAAILFIGFGLYLIIDYIRKSVKEFKENEEQEDVVEVIEETAEESEE